VKGLVSHDHLASVELLELIDLQALPTIDGWPAADLFGDGSLWALPSVGHSPGHMSFLALTDPAPTLLTGDAAHIELNWTETLAPGFSDDPEQAVQAIEDLQGIHDDLGQPELIFGHGL
jgi:glyoxylase-like metal-dependent hydrolase (beta-lactamase superfamily II)